MSYQLTNSIYRAIDSYNRPEDATLMKKIQGVRLLFENQGFCRYVPNRAELRERLTNLLVEAMNSTEHRQHIDECYDIAIQVGCEIPILQVQDEMYRHYIIEAVNRRNKPMATTLKQIALDSQNVHNTIINERVKKLIMTLCKDHPMPSQPKLDGKPFMNVLPTLLCRHPNWNHAKNSKSLSFIQKSEGRFGIGLTLHEMLYALISFIQTRAKDEQNELYAILNQELTSMSGKCSTGHMARMLNVVQGFSERYDLTRVVDRTLIKSVLVGALNDLLKEECKTNDDLLIGMVSKSEEYTSFLTKAYEQTKPKLLEQFGEEHSDTIDSLFSDYCNQ